MDNVEVTREMLDEYTKAYNQGKPLIPDNVYEQLEEEYIRQHGEESRPFLRAKQTDVVTSLTGTLPKVYGVVDAMRANQTSYKDWIRRKNIPSNAKIIIQPKFDGCSVACDSDMRFFTRGDYDNGESVDVTELFKPYFDIELPVGCKGMKFEAIISKDIFQSMELYKTYLTPRDATSAIITSRNVALSKYVTLVPLREELQELGVQYVSDQLQQISITTTTAHDYDTIQRFISDKLSDGACAEYNGQTYAIDGVVVSVVNDECATLQEIAIKILHDVHNAKLVDVKYQLGVTGKITPVAVITPTLFADGKRTVTNIGLSTIKRVLDMSLRYNDTVRVMYNIVPYLIDSMHDGDMPIQVPTTCPICGDELDLSHPETVRCMNSNCDGRRIGSIVRYVKYMKMIGISKATITNLYESGLVTCISDLYKLTKEKIIQLDGYKETSAENILNSIYSASQECPVSRWLGALPFKDVSSKTWDMLLNQCFGIDELNKSNKIIQYINDDPDKFIYDILTQYYNGIGNATIRAINEGWMKNYLEMREILKHMTFKITTVSNVSPMNTFVTFTGCRDMELVEWLNNKGIGVIDFGSKTQYLIIPNKEYQNKKTQVAKSKGLYILTIDEVKYFFEPF